MNRTVRIRALAAVVAATSLVAACGDDDDDGAEEPAVSTTAAAPAAGGDASPTSASPGEGDGAGAGEQPSGDPVKLMIIYEQERGVASPEAPEGANAAAEAINANGGIAGRPVEILECDTQNDPNAAAECGRQAVSEEVVAVVGSFSQQSDQYMPILEAAGIPSVGLIPATGPDYTSPTSFPLIGGSLDIAGMGNALATAGSTTISVARIDVPTAAIFVELVNAGLAQFGQTVDHEVVIPLGAPDMSTYATAATEGEVDGVAVGLTSQDAINFIIATRQASPDVNIAFTTTEVPSVVEAVVDALGDDAEGILRATAIPEQLSTPEFEQYVADMEAAGFDETGGDFRLNSYAAVRVVEQVAQTVQGELTAASLLAALPTVEGLRTGLLPPVQFTTGGVGGFPRVFSSCLVRTEIVDGELTQTSEEFFDAFTGEACPAP